MILTQNLSKEHCSIRGFICLFNKNDNEFEYQSVIHVVTKCSTVGGYIFPDYEVLYILLEIRTN